MTTPSDPFGPPGDPSQPPPTWGQAPGQQPGHGQQPPAYGQQPPAYGQQPGFGAPPPGWGQPPQKTGTNGLAIASLVTAFLCWPAGLVLGFLAKSQIKTSGQGGAGLATAGIVISILNAVFSILIVASGGFATA